MSRIPSPARGFTLVELLVVLAIAALVLSVTPSLFSAALPGVETKAAARRTVATLRLARESAIRRGLDMALIVDVERRRLELDGYRAIELSNRLEVQLDAASSEMRNEHQGAIRFFPDGSSTGGRVRLLRGDSGYEVGVEWLTGRIHLIPWKRD